MTPRNESDPLKVGDYVTIIDTRDEWEDLVGILIGFRDANDELAPAGSARAKWASIRFPVSKASLRETRLDGVNEYTSYVVYQLKQNNFLQTFPIAKLEWFDKEDL